MKFLYAFLMLVALFVTFGAYSIMMDRFSANLSQNLERDAVKFEPFYSTPWSNIRLPAFNPQALVDPAHRGGEVVPLRPGEAEEGTTASSSPELTPEEVADGARFIQEAYKQLEIQLKKPRPTFIVPDKVNFARSQAPCRSYRTTAGALGGMTYYFATRKNTALALRGLAGLGGFFVGLFPDGTLDHNLIGYMTAHETLAIFGLILLRTAEHLHPPKSAVLKLMENHAILAGQFPSPVHVIKVEKQSNLSLIDVLTTQGYVQKNPCFDLGGLMGALKEEMSSEWDPYLPLFDKPWPEVRNTLNELRERDLASFQEIDKNLFLRLSPRQRAARRLLHLNMSQFSKCLRREQAILNAGFTAFALESFRTEKGTYPASLKDLSAWLGKPVGKDEYTNAEFTYSPNPLRLSSPGMDIKYGTRDDIVFIPSAEYFKPK